MTDRLRDLVFEGPACQWLTAGDWLFAVYRLLITTT